MVNRFKCLNTGLHDTTIQLAVWQILTVDFWSLNTLIKLESKFSHAILSFWIPNYLPQDKWHINKLWKAYLEEREDCSDIFFKAHVDHPISLIHTEIPAKQWIKLFITILVRHGTHVYVLNTVWYSFLTGTRTVRYTN